MEEESAPEEEEVEEEVAAAVDEEEESISVKNNQRDKTRSKGLGVAIQIIFFFKQTLLRPGFSDNVSLIRPFV